MHVFTGQRLIDLFAHDLRVHLGSDLLKIFASLVIELVKFVLIKFDFSKLLLLQLNFHVQIVPYGSPNFLVHHEVLVCSEFGWNFLLIAEVLDAQVNEQVLMQLIEFGFLLCNEIFL